MLQELRSCGRQISVEELESLERLIAHRLPGHYRRFLLQHNGGVPVPNAFPIKGFKEHEGELQVFFGVARDIESSNLSWNFTAFKNRLPPDQLAIACDSVGDLICLCLSGVDPGAVFFWDSFDERAPPSYGNMYKLAPTFEAFLETLCDKVES